MFRARRAAVNLDGLPSRSMDDMTPEKAAAIVRELGEALGGEHGRAIEVVLQRAEQVPRLLERLTELRGRKSSTRLQAVGAASLGAQHFAKATADLQEARSRFDSVAENITAGLAEVQRGTRALREEETGPAPTEPVEGES